MSQLQSHSSTSAVVSSRSAPRNYPKRMLSSTHIASKAILAPIPVQSSQDISLNRFPTIATFRLVKLLITVFTVRMSFMYCKRFRGRSFVAAAESRPTGFRIDKRVSAVCAEEVELVVRSLLARESGIVDGNVGLIDYRSFTVRASDREELCFHVSSKALYIFRILRSRAHLVIIDMTVWVPIFC